MNTVNVIEISDTDKINVTLYAFTDDKKGNIEAENLFEKLVRETVNFPTRHQVDCFLEDGICQVSPTSSILLVHSS